jgi:hypothetical protein
MNSRRRTYALVGLLILLGASILWYRFGPGEVPAGQPALVTLDTTSLQQFREDFNQDARGARVIVLLSPT